MALSKERIHRGRETAFPWERAALDFVIGELPDTDPHQLWELQELLDPNTGRLYELDMLVLGRHALYLVEIKSHPGVLKGDTQDWRFIDGTMVRRLECPFSLTNHKARVLGDLLERRLPGRPFVQPLVFVYEQEKEGAPPKIQLDVPTPEWLLERRTLKSLILNGMAAGRGRLVDRDMVRKLSQALRDLGLKASTHSRLVAGYNLKESVDEGPGYQEHRAVKDGLANDTARIRSYLAARQTTTETRQTINRTAEREADVLSRLGQHPSILGYRHFEPNAPLGPAIVFEAFDQALPLHVFLRTEPGLPFDDRLQILRRVAEALAHVHRAGFVHRNLSPASVLVRRTQQGRIEVRLHRFHLAVQADHNTLRTRHFHQLVEDLDRLYQAPEVIRDPDTADSSSDVFSLGCIAWLLWTGQNPAPTLPERERQLQQPEGLLLSSLRGDLATLDEAIRQSANWRPSERCTDTLQWLEEYVLARLRRTEAVSTVDPYEAQPSDRLAGYIVQRLVGSGATARVFLIKQGDEHFALKVPHDAGCISRIEAEFRVLRRLRSARIVEACELLDLGGRRCLRMEYAGERTLDEELRDRGTLDLDHARRYGEDLLQALEYLEEQSVIHRDIKPGNLGFSMQSKKAKHLVLFDFSLSEEDPCAVSSGTPEWRDPWLHERGSWDYAADRYSAAAVLYRMLTGVRPKVLPDGVRVEAERFDAALRDRLSLFFMVAFDRDAASRHRSAEAMRSEWGALFESPRAAPVDDNLRELDRVRPTTPVEALPLTTQARNALDRAGIHTTAELLQLPRNRLSALRGVGRATQKEIVDLANDLDKRLKVAAAVPLLADYCGPDLHLEIGLLALSADALTRLLDAGIHTTLELSTTPRDQLDHLLGADAPPALAAALGSLADQQPNALDAWVQALLAPRRKDKSEAERRIRALLGLDPLPRGTDDPAPPGARSAAQIAAAFKIDAALVHSSLQHMRDQWHQSPVLPDLMEAVRAAMPGPVALLDDVAATLARASRQTPDTSTLRKATALVRLVTELRNPPLFWERLGRGLPWLAFEAATLTTLKNLGGIADLMVGGEEISSTDTARKALPNQVLGSALESLPFEQLVLLAAAASEHTAASARLELYPRGLDPQRAILLSASVLTGDMNVEAVQQRVAARYPEARPLPDRPGLDALLQQLGLDWDPDALLYRRSGGGFPTASSTVQPSRPRPHPISSPEQAERLRFQDALDRSLQAGRFRVIKVQADFAVAATEYLSQVVGVPPTSLDAAFWASLQAKAAALHVRPDVILAADREGPTGLFWDRLQRLAAMAADEVVAALLGNRSRPQLLVYPGFFSRYRLAAALDRLAARAEHDEGAAIFLLLPANNDGRSPSINGTLPVPAPLPAQRLEMPPSWLPEDVLRSNWL